REEAHVLSVDGAARNLRHGYRLEIRPQERQLVELATNHATRNILRGAHRDLLAPPAARKKTDACLDETDIGLECGNRPVAVHDELARTAKRHAAHGGDRGHEAVAELERRLLELGDNRFDYAP